jgi:hypothetical protein
VLLARAVVLQARRDTAGGAAISNKKVGEEGKFLRWFLLFCCFHVRALTADLTVNFSCIVRLATRGIGDFIPGDAQRDPL